ncbi:Ig-like domain (group 2) [Candidatus Methanophagaceae archaeon]|nr:Ig-like domain (group 2) [Methanophagales archaeon]
MRKDLFLIIIYICFGLLFITPLVSADGTTEVHIAMYANDGTTLLNETTVDHEWLMRNLEVYGDGVTHYYHQGPIFEDYWNEVHPNETYDNRNPSEDMNVLGKDLGAVKGTNVKDLCDLVGGMSEGDTVEVKANDGFGLKFPYSNVYEPDPRQGPMVVTWYTLDANESGEISGYVPDGYSNGMRLVFFADTATNPWGKHVFGIGDMCACLPEDCWHYYQYPDYPTTTGYTMKYVNRIHIYSRTDSPELSAITVSPADITLDEGETQQFNATAYDTDGKELPFIRFTWSSSAEYIGSIDENGLFDAKAAGTVTIRAENGTVSGIMNVTVHEDDRRDRTYSSDSYGDSQFSPVLTAIYVSPQSVTVNARDATQQFNATAYDQNNHEMVDIVFNWTWTNTNTTVGTINTTGFFIAIPRGNATPAPSPPPLPRPTNVPSAPPTPTETPALTATPTPSAQGFEALFVFAGFVAGAYVHKRRRSIK